VPLNDVPGLSGQECHHVYLDAMFSLFHQAEINQTVCEYEQKHSLGLFTTKNIHQEFVPFQENV
jgi:hypothetical protein